MTTITIDRAVVEQALEALEYHVEQTRPIHRTSEAIAALKAALEPADLPLEDALSKAYYYDAEGKWRDPETRDWDRWHAVAKVAVALIQRGALTESREHITDGTPCWCNPETAYTDPDTGASVIIHKRPQ
jgi:hypothetical protein